jgi:peptidylprolyl isomerase domain and WD repeat-containing protein 1
MKRGLACLPSAPMYERSYMHKDAVSHVSVSHRFEFIFTASTDGFLKFWKKAAVGIEFVKTFRAHLTKISGVALSKNEQRLATVCPMEQTMKLFDVSNFDVIHIIKLDFTPSVCEFINKTTSLSPLLAIADAALPKIWIVNSEQSQNEKKSVVVSEMTYHETPVRLIRFNQVYNLVVSTDQSGVIEVWDPDTLELPDYGRLAFEVLSDTDYCELVLKKTFALAVEFSHDGHLMAIFCRDRRIRIFEFKTGKLVKTYHSETLE